MARSLASLKLKQGLVVTADISGDLCVKASGCVVVETSGGGGGGGS